MVTNITPVLPCGGSGTRLWPLSRKTHPKQFVKLQSDLTMLQETARRVTGDGFSAPIVVTSEPFRFIVAEQLEEMGIRPQAILLEPSAKNTAPAVLSAAIWCELEGQNTTLAVMPTDHKISDSDAFCTALVTAADACSGDQLVTMGIRPSFPATGYGYILPKSDLKETGVPVARFIEKPDQAKAQRLLEDDNNLWNAGVFVFEVRTIIEAFETHASEMIEPVTQAIKQAQSDFGFLRLDETAWDTCPAESIDYAIMEKAQNVTVVPLDAGWSDIGSWDAVWDESQSDEQGVVAKGDVTALDCKNSLLHSEDRQVLVAVGLENIVVVAEKDAVLVVDKTQATKVGDAVKMLREAGVKQADQSRREHRPWGWFESLIARDNFHVKQIYLKPGATVSLQSHKYRAEHWIVVDGTAEVTIGDQVKRVEKDQSIYVPLGSIHRMHNPTGAPMRLIEVQTGTYFGEDDIIRYEDVYARN